MFLFLYNSLTSSGRIGNRALTIHIYRIRVLINYRPDLYMKGYKMNNEPDYNDNLYFEEKKMTQKIFDTDNAEDMALLWSILPESCKKITVGNMWDCVWEDSERFSYRSLFKINWHDKREITRPIQIQEATDADIGKLCKFWNDKSEEFFGRLGHIGSKYFTMIAPVYEDLQFLHCRRLTKQEIEELC